MYMVYKTNKRIRQSPKKQKSRTRCVHGLSVYVCAWCVQWNYPRRALIKRTKHSKKKTPSHNQVSVQTCSDLQSTSMHTIPHKLRK